MEIRVQIRGLKEISLALLELPKRIDRKVLDDGLLAGAQMIRDEARTLVPELRQPDPRWQRGAIKRAIRATRIRPREYTAEAIVSVRRLSKSAISRIKKRQAKAAAAGKKSRIGGRFIPGDAFYWHWVEFGTAKMRAQPFLRPAFEARKQQAVDLAIRRFRERIQLEIQKIGRSVGF